MRQDGRPKRKPSKSQSQSKFSKNEFTYFARKQIYINWHLYILWVRSCQFFFHNDLHLASAKSKNQPTTRCWLACDVKRKNVFSWNVFENRPFSGKYFLQKHESKTSEVIFPVWPFDLGRPLTIPFQFQGHRSANKDLSYLLCDRSWELVHEQFVLQFPRHFIKSPVWTPWASCSKLD